MLELQPLPLYKEQILEGLEKLSSRIRLLIAHFAPGHFEVLQGIDSVFLEPLLFAYFSRDQSKVTLEQLLWGYLPDSHKCGNINVYADENGRIELPEYGYLHTRKRDCMLTLTYDSTMGRMQLAKEDREVEFEFEPYKYLSGTNIRLNIYQNPLLKEQFVNDQNEVQFVEVINLSRERIAQIENAFDAISSLIPQYESLIKITTKSILLYKGEQPYSFASMGAYGMVFLQTDDDSDEIFFAEDLIHQCGHVIFSALCHTVQFLKIPDDFLVRTLTLKQEENRTVFVTLHGLYTEAWMSKFLAMYYISPIADSTQQMEILGRLVMIFTRFGLDLSGIYSFDIFSDSGRDLMESFLRLYRSVYDGLKQDMQKVVIANQPYCFNRKLFLQANSVLVNE